MARVIQYQPYQISLPSEVYLDANFLIDVHLPTEKHLTACWFFHELKAKRVAVVTSPLAIDEALYKQWIIYYEIDHGPYSWKRDADKRVARDIFLSRRARYRDKLRNFCDSMEGLVSFIGYTVDALQIVKVATVNIQQYNLLPRDAFHLAILQAACISAIVTNDRHFDNPVIPSLDVYHY